MFILASILLSAGFLLGLSVGASLILIFFKKEEKEDFKGI